MSVRVGRFASQMPSAHQPPPGHAAVPLHEAKVAKRSSRGSSAGRLLAYSGTILAPFRHHFGFILRYFSDRSGPYPKQSENNAPQNHLVIRNVRVQLNLGLGRPSKESIIYITFLYIYIYVDDRRACLVVITLGNPHLLECAQGGKDGTTDPHRLFAFGRRDVIRRGLWPQGV